MQLRDNSRRRGGTSDEYSAESADGDDSAPTLIAGQNANCPDRIRDQGIVLLSTGQNLAIRGNPTQKNGSPKIGNNGASKADAMHTILNVRGDVTIPIARSTGHASSRCFLLI